MRDLPDIVLELRKQEKLGGLNSKSLGIYQNLHESEKISNENNNKTILYHEKDFKNSTYNESYNTDDIPNLIDNSISLFEISPEIIMFTDIKGNVLNVNSRILDWLGYEREDIIGKNLLRLPFFADKYKNNVFDFSMDVLFSEKFLSYELDFITKSGEKRTGSVHAVPIKNVNNKISGGLIMISDVTESKTARDEINKLSQFQNSVIDNANVWLSAMNLIGNVVIWNKAAEAITGYLREDVLGNDNVWNWLSLKELESKNEITTKRTTHMEDELLSQNFETLIKRKDGKFRTISWNSSNILDNSKNPIGSITLGLDITDQKRYEKEIKRQNAELKKLNRIKSDFLNEYL